MTNRDVAVFLITFALFTVLMLLVTLWMGKRK